MKKIEAIEALREEIVALQQALKLQVLRRWPAAGANALSRSRPSA